MSEVKCYDCGHPYGDDRWIEAVVPDDDWITISPTGGEGGILCISCMSKRFRDIGRYKVPVWLVGTEAIQPSFDSLEGDPSEYDLLSMVARKCMSVMRLAVRSGSLDEKDVEWCGHLLNEVTLNGPDTRDKAVYDLWKEEGSRLDALLGKGEMSDSGACNHDS